MRTGVGVCIYRQTAEVAVFERTKEGVRCVFSHSIQRDDQTALTRILGSLLDSIPPSHRGIPLHLALSNGDLALADSWKRPSGLSDKDLEIVIPTVVEGRCAGETLEDLSIAHTIARNLVRAVAIRTDLLEDLRKVAKEKGFTVSRITSLSAALADLVNLDEESVRFARGGELHEFTRNASGVLWRSVPIDVIDRGIVHHVLPG